MKNTYVKPEMQVEEFLVNNYCAGVCGKKDGKYIFTCDAPAGTVYYYNDNGNKRYLGGYHPCEKKHITDGPGNYKEGFVDINSNGQEDDGEGALIWIERGFFGNINDWHASASLTRQQIEVERS